MTYREHCIVGSLMAVPVEFFDAVIKTMEKKGPISEECRAIIEKLRKQREDEKLNLQKELMHRKKGGVMR